MLEQKLWHPFCKGDYSEKADLVIITHEHDDHNRLELITLNENAVILRAKDMITTVDGELVWKTKLVRDVSVAAQPAQNKNLCRRHGRSVSRRS